MKTFLLGLLIALASVSASADAIFSQDSTQIILRDDAGCKSAKVRDLIVESEVGRFHSAEVTFQDKKLDACWTLDGDKVLIIDEDAQAGMLPAKIFKPYNGV